MIDNISVDSDGLIELYNGDNLLASGRSPHFLSYAIRQHDGPAPVIRTSTAWQESEILEELDYIWQQTCELL